MMAKFYENIIFRGEKTCFFWCIQTMNFQRYFLFEIIFSIFPQIDVRPMSHRLSHRLRHHRWRHHFLELVRLTNHGSRISRPDITLECLRWIISRDWIMWHNSSLSQSDRHICVMCVTNVTKRRFALSSFRYTFSRVRSHHHAYAILTKFNGIS